MKNREKFAEEILNIACTGNSIAVKKGTNRIIGCSTIDCHSCRFHSSVATCDELISKWCEEEYVEPQIDWSKVPVDTPILVATSASDFTNGKFLNRYFSRYEDGRIYAWDRGCTSWSAKEPKPDGDYKGMLDSPWDYAKLANEEVFYNEE